MSNGYDSIDAGQAQIDETLGQRLTVNAKADKGLVARVNYVLKAIEVLRRVFTEESRTSAVIINVSR